MGWMGFGFSVKSPLCADGRSLVSMKADQSRTDDSAILIETLTLQSVSLQLFSHTHSLPCEPSELVDCVNVNVLVQYRDSKLT